MKQVKLLVDTEVKSQDGHVLPVYTGMLVHIADDPIIIDMRVSVTYFSVHNVPYFTYVNINDLEGVG